MHSPHSYFLLPVHRVPDVHKPAGPTKLSVMPEPGAAGGMGVNSRAGAVGNRGKGVGKFLQWASEGLVSKGLSPPSEQSPPLTRDVGV